MVVRAFLVVALLPGLAGCQPLRLAARFFLSDCPADGPAQESELRLHLEPVSMPEYYEALATAAPAVPRREIARSRFQSEEFPIFAFGPMGSVGGARLLVIAGVHGNEIAGALAAARILRALRDDPTWSRGIELHLVAPANPVGLAHLSRYNAAGCDVNRDFGPFRTAEAAALRDVLHAVAPALAVSLHEGPQAGFYVIATQSAPHDAALAMARAAAGSGIVLAGASFVGGGLGTPGVEHEGRLKTGLKRVLGIDSFGAYAHRHGVGTLTTESPWELPDVEARVAAHVAAVRGAVAYLQQRQADVHR